MQIPRLVRALAVTLLAVSGCTQSPAPSAPAAPPKTPSVAASPPSEPAPPTVPPPPVAAPPPQAAGMATVPLPAPAEEVRVGAGGRRLVLRLKNQAKLAILDVVAGKLVGDVSLEDRDDLFAVSQERLVLVGRKSRTLKVYTLADLKPESERAIPGTLPLVAAGMGASSQGPLFVICAEIGKVHVFLVELPSLQLVKHIVRLQVEPSQTCCLNASSDGSTVAVWDRRRSGGECAAVLSLTAGRLDHCLASAAFTYLSPDDHGERISAGNQSCLDVRGKPIAESQFPPDVQAVPAIGGPYYLTFPWQREAHPGSARQRGNRTPRPATAKKEVAVYLVGESQPIASLPTSELPWTSIGEETLSRGDLYQRLFFLPAAGVIAVLPDALDAVTLYPLDVKEGLRRTFAERLVIASTPPKLARLGETFRYPIEVQSKGGKPTFQLDSGPEGMTVSPTGQVEWTPAALPESGSVSVTIAIAESGQTKSHSFALKVVPAAPVFARAEEGPPAEYGANRPGRPDVHLGLPAEYDDHCLGGDGRYLVFRLPTLGKLAVVDVAAAKLVGYVAASAGALFAAGMDKLVVMDPQRSVLERFDLKTQQREESQPCPLPEGVSRVVLGAASQGPVLLAAANRAEEAELMLVDLASLKRLDYETKMPNLQVKQYHWDTLAASADGHVFSMVGLERSCVLVFNGQTLVSRDIPKIFYGWALPNANGESICTMLGVVGDRVWKTPEIKVVSNPFFSRDYYVPAVHGPYYLRLRREAGGCSVTLCLADEERPLATLPEIPLRSLDPSAMTHRSNDLPSRYLYLIPKAQVLVYLPEGGEQIVLRRFDLDRELERTQPRHLAVVSRPPRRAVPGQTFEYQLDVRSQAGQVACRLEAGPKGLEVSPEGRVRWKVDDPPEVAHAEVRIQVSDASGQSVPHTFALTTRDVWDLAEGAIVPASQSPPAGMQRRIWKLTKVNDHRLEWSGEEAVLVPGLNYQSMLALQGDRLSRLSADGMTIIKTHKLAKAYRRIGERPEYYVALAAEPPALDLLDKKTLRPIRHIECGSGLAEDLALHPTRPLCYATVRQAESSFESQFLVVDEPSGDIRRSDDFFGHWIAVDACGARLLTVGSVGGRAGSNVIVTPRPGVPAPPMPPRPGRWGAGQIPYYGNGQSLQIQVLPAYWWRSVLALYELADDGTPFPSAALVLEPVDRLGLRVASDGLRAACLGNHTFNLETLDEKPREFEVEGGLLDLAFHPALPLMACLGPKGPRLLERDSGQPDSHALKYRSAELEDAKFHRVWFSADGCGLLLDLEPFREGRSLYRATLDLSTEEQKTVAHRLAHLASLGRDLLAEHPPEPGHGDIPLAEIDAFKGDRFPELSAKEIGRRFTDAVVLVRNGQNSGTGFVVGASGYILTCAHCVRDAGNIVVSYRVKQGDEVTMKPTPAKRLHMDLRKDLALLKIDQAPDLPTVRLALEASVESGERVTIIGNPGVGATVLDYTMTEGIVSNPRRQLGHQVLIQTSAAVNPGTSGAPLINANGQVIGLVVLKASIEAAGFAVPARELTSFLAMAVNASGPEGAIQRHWYDAKYQHDTSAEYLGIQNNAVQLRRADGKKLSVPLVQLSPQDQAFLRLFQPEVPKDKK